MPPILSLVSVREPHSFISLAFDFRAKCAHAFLFRWAAPSSPASFFLPYFSLSSPFWGDALFLASEDKKRQ